jgi:FixJ family two-component response regulator
LTSVNAACPAFGQADSMGQTLAPVVYVVEDDPAVRDSIRALLECENLGVRGFASCEELLAERAPWRFACLLLDVNLPSMNGLDFLEGLRARGFAGNAVIMTANPDPVVRRRAAEAGAMLLEKPFDRQALLDLVRKQIGA